jgi:NAD+ synthase (glutamine-hydrolysing)
VAVNGLLPPVRVALAQVNSRVGDLEGNVEKIAGRIDEARDAGAELVLFPELAVTGYPPEDLLLKEHFLAAAREALESAADHAGDGLIALIGFPERGFDVYNALALCTGGEVRAVYRKNVLPNYGVFDEQRYFQVGDGGAVLDLGGARIGLTVCEDIWTPGPPASEEALAGASLILNASASPYHAGKGAQRERMLAQRARDNLCAVAFTNLVGGQDELIFDGHSLVVDHEGQVIARAPQFAESLLLANIDVQAALTARLRDTRLRPPVRRHLAEVRQLGEFDRGVEPDGEVGGDVTPLLERCAEVYAALALGVRDYVEKNGFERVVIGLSGGIDSALTLLVAADALGGDRVTCVTMPSRYSSEGTRSDAQVLADNLGVELHEIAIGPMMDVYEEVLAPFFAGREPDITEENLQARIRGNLLMALSNKFGWLVLTTGNKSENSVGYSTLYGDSAGGFAVIKDVPKTLVYELVAFRNARDEKSPVPQSLIDRPPSAELRADQVDQDSLPDYPTLDAILEAYIEEDAGRQRLVNAGMPEEAVDRVLALVDRAEYKRRQAPPGIKITPRAFGRDRRMPITNRFRG